MIYYITLILHECIVYSKYMFNFLFNHNTIPSQQTVADKAVHSFGNAHSRRAKEIESLRLYDRGEKEITPSNLRSLSKSV